MTTLGTTEEGTIERPVSFAFGVLGLALGIP